MKKKKNVTNTVSWVGINDWELRQFHGNEYSTKEVHHIIPISFRKKKKC
jgi:flavorubredoxin